MAQILRQGTDPEFPARAVRQTHGRFEEGPDLAELDLVPVGPARLFRLSGGRACEAHPAVVRLAEDLAEDLFLRGGQGVEGVNEDRLAGKVGMRAQRVPQPGEQIPPVDALPVQDLLVGGVYQRGVGKTADQVSAPVPLAAAGAGPLFLPLTDQPVERFFRLRGRDAGGCYYSRIFSVCSTSSPLKLACEY